jgi:chitinase
VIFCYNFGRNKNGGITTMMKRKLLLPLVIVITFIGGFLTGTVVTTHKNQDFTQPKIKNAPLSAIKPKLKDVPKIKTEPKKVLIGYVQDFRNPNDVEYEKLTHVIFSFAHPTAGGNILLNGDTALKNLRATVKNASIYHTKVMLAIGGWYHIQGGESYPYFKAALATPTSRTKMVTQLTRIVDQEKLDGIDIDFEYPRSSIEAKNLSAFSNELSHNLHLKGKELSVAVNSKINAANGSTISSVVYDTSMFQNVDHVNIMAYDGQWDGGYNAANLSTYPFAVNIVNYWTKLFDSIKLPKEKLVLGVPFYAQPENQAIKQVSYAAIVHQHPANANSDIVKMNGTTYHYNGEITMKKKTKLALEHGFGGVMMWEAGHDAKGPNSLTRTIFSVLNVGSSQYADVN